MAVKHITGTIRNTDGATVSFTGTITIAEDPVVALVTVDPDPAPPGTLRTITIKASDPNNLPLTYTCFVDGIPAVPVSGPPGVFVHDA